MLQDILTQDQEILKFLSGGDYSNAAKNLLTQQKAGFKQCCEGYSTLQEVKVKEFIFDGFTVKIQFNPARMSSSSAKVDEESVKGRECFLCHDNFPDGQRGILYEDEYLLLCNPFPIFKEHFTIPHKNHIPQAIYNSFGKMLSVSKALAEYYTVFYNGPECGASAPDHQHFQAGNKFYMPVDAEYPVLKEKYGSTIYTEKEFNIYAINDGLRKIIAIESPNEILIQEHFKAIYDYLMEETDKSKTEPMLNLISFYDADGWRVLLFPRAKHRPSHYYREDSSKILLSPASSDMDGLCILPREEDFNKITKEDIADVFHEIFISDEKFNKLVNNISKELP